MRYIPVVERSNGSKQRFYNSVEEVSMVGISKNLSVSFVKEGEISREDLESMHLVNDGLTPYPFTGELYALQSDEESLRIISTMLLVTGYCQRCLRNNATDDPTALMLEERVEQLQSKSNDHRKLLNHFDKVERERESLFDHSDDLEEILQELTQSAQEMRLVSDDIRLALDHHVPSDL